MSHDDEPLTQARSNLRAHSYQITTRHKNNTNHIIIVYRIPLSVAAHYLCKCKHYVVFAVKSTLHEYSTSTGYIVVVVVAFKIAGSAAFKLQLDKLTLTVVVKMAGEWVSVRNNEIIIEENKTVLTIALVVVVTRACT